MSQCLYLWAVTPPEAATAQIEVLRQEFAVNFKSVEALKPPVHITLYKPFMLPEAMTEAAADRFRRWISTQPAFTLELNNFGFFENARSPVVFIAVMPNADLKTLNSGLSQLTRKTFDFDTENNNPYHPHITIGYRDILPVFPEVKQAYSKRIYQASFQVQELYLFKHNGKKWEVQYRFPLGAHHAHQNKLW